jgi:hypothetical protein
MYDHSYRAQAERARRLSEGTTTPDIADTLAMMAWDFDDIAEDLESGAVEIRHRERMPQYRRQTGNN